MKHEKIVDGDSLRLDIPFDGSVKVCPETAIVWMERNTDNRRIRPRLVQYLRHCIEEGDWQGDHPQPIVFSASGRLIDGQHRLEAIIQCGKTVVIKVVTMARDELRLHIDTGVSRTLDDRLSLDEDKNTNKRIIEMINCRMVLGGKYGRQERATPNIARTMFDESRIGFLYAAEICRTKIPRITTAPTSLAISEYFLRNEQLCRIFTECLLSPDGRGGIQQAIYLRNSLVPEISCGTSSGVRRRYGRTVYSMMCHRNQKQITRMSEAVWED